MSTSLSTIGMWAHDGSITDLQVSPEHSHVYAQFQEYATATDCAVSCFIRSQLSDLGHNNEVLVVIASSKGSCVLGRLMLPRSPGTELDEVQVRL